MSDFTTTTLNPGVFCLLILLLCAHSPGTSTTHHPPTGIEFQTCAVINAFHVFSICLQLCYKVSGERTSQVCLTNIFLWLLPVRPKATVLSDVGCSQKTADPPQRALHTLFLVSICPCQQPLIDTHIEAHNETPGKNKWLASTPVSVWNLDHTWEDFLLEDRREVISEERELMSAKDVVLSNEVRVGLLTASVNSVGESKR